MLSNTKNLKFILGSSSPRRLELLKQINCYPNEIFKPEINEDPQKKELPIWPINKQKANCLVVFNDSFERMNFASTER